jgi:hypothetical protein
MKAPRTASQDSFICMYTLQRKLEGNEKKVCFLFVHTVYAGDMIGALLCSRAEFLGERMRRGAL